MGAEVWTKGADKPLKSGELVTGDADFDRLFRLKGPEAPSRAMLSAPARQLIKSMGLLSKLVTVMFVSVADGCIYHRANGVPPAPAKTRETFESLISLGRLMSFPEDGVADRLRQNMASESDAAVRQATADVLSRLDADSPA